MTLPSTQVPPNLPSQPPPTPTLLIIWREFLVELKKAFNELGAIMPVLIALFIMALIFYLGYLAFAFIFPDSRSIQLIATMLWWAIGLQFSVVQTIVERLIDGIERRSFQPSQIAIVTSQPNDAYIFDGVIVILKIIRSGFDKFGQWLRISILYTSKSLTGGHQEYLPSRIVGSCVAFFLFPLYLLAEIAFFENSLVSYRPDLRNPFHTLNSTLFPPDNPNLILKVLDTLSTDLGFAALVGFTLTIILLAEIVIDLIGVSHFSVLGDLRNRKNAFQFNTAPLYPWVRALFVDPINRLLNNWAYYVCLFVALVGVVSAAALSVMLNATRAPTIEIAFWQQHPETFSQYPYLQNLDPGTTTVFGWNVRQLIQLGATAQSLIAIPMIIVGILILSQWRFFFLVVYLALASIATIPVKICISAFNIAEQLAQMGKDTGTNIAPQVITMLNELLGFGLSAMSQAIQTLVRSINLVATAVFLTPLWKIASRILATYNGKTHDLFFD